MQTSFLLITTGALLIEAMVGYPDRLYRLIRHPVVWFGALIGGLDRRLNREADSFARRRAWGIAALLALLLATVLPALAVQEALLRFHWVGLGVLALLAAALPAQRSLHQHVAAVAEGLEEGGLEGGRAAVALIVGRNPESLDEAGVVRAATESLAENFSDGVVAPAVWCVLGGLPGVVFYKAVNTADSMVGHRSARHAAYGWAAARLDDVVNLPASRLAALWIILAASLMPGMDVGGAMRAVWRDARHHRSPNAGWPEAAMAGALGLRLAGPRVYGEQRVEDGWMGDGRAEATPADLRRALALYRLACRLQLIAVAWGAALLLG
jgi:adenosylcobinamide-phosphate synthase